MEENAKKKNSKLTVALVVIGILFVLGTISNLTNKGTDTARDAQDKGGVTEGGTPAADNDALADTEPENNKPSDDVDKQNYTLEHGELVSAIVNDFGDGPVLVIKAKISSSYSNTATIRQNYYNIEDLIRNQSCAGFYEIQYWAVADMSNGSEEKVISFTVPANLIQQIADGSIAANMLGDYVKELFIHSSLKE